MVKNVKTMTALFAAISMMFVMSVSQAITLSLENITNNNSIDLSSQLLVDVSSVGSGVEFKFTNDVGIASSITDVYFDLGSNTGLFSTFSIAAQSTGVSYDLSPSPGNLPGGNTIDFTSDFGGDSTAPQTSANGVNATGEFITFLGTLGSGMTYDNFLADLMNGTFRVGLHIQAINDYADCENSPNPDCGSDSYVSVNPVPVPAAAWLFGTALLGFFATTRRKN